jgi:hypothetical protein
VYHRRENTPSKQSFTVWDEVFLTGQKYTNFEKASKMTKVAELPRFVRVRWPTKSVNKLSIGWVQGLAACQPTRVLGGLRTLTRVICPQIFKKFGADLGPPKIGSDLVEILTAPQMARQNRIMKISEKHVPYRGGDDTPTSPRFLGEITQ